MRLYSNFKINNKLPHRIILLFLVSIIIAGIIGPLILTEQFLVIYYFSLYKFLGAVTPTWIIVFLLFIRNKFDELSSKILPSINFIYLFLVIFLIIAFFLLRTTLLSYSSIILVFPLVIAAHLIVLLIPIFLILSILGLNFVKSIFSLFGKEVLYSGVISLFFVIFLFKLSSSLVALANVETLMVKNLIELTTHTNVVVSDKTLIFDKFAVHIGETCSGIESFFLFSVLYFLIVIIEWKKINKAKAFFIYFPTILGLFLLNIIRIYLLIITGLVLSKNFSLQTLHTYLGLIFFVSYFFLFLKLVFPFVLKIRQ